MEVALTGSHGIAKQAIISIRAGSVRRQAALSALDKPFRFPCTPEECGSLKVDLLTLVGTARVICHPGDHDYSLQLEQPVTIDGSAAGKQEVSLKVRRAAGEARGRQEDDRAKRKEQALHSSEGYLEKHKILPLLQGILQSLLKEQPEDPYKFVASQFGRDAEGWKEDDAKLKAQEALLVALDADADEEGSPVDDAKPKAQEALLVALDADAAAAEEAKEKAQRALVAALEEEFKEKAQCALVAALDACEEEEAKEKAQHALVAALDADEGWKEDDAKLKAQEALLVALDADADEEGSPVDDAKPKAQEALLVALDADADAAEDAKEKAQRALVAALDADEEEEAKEKAQCALVAALDACEEEEAKEKAQHALVAALDADEEDEAKKTAQHALMAVLDADEEEEAKEKAQHGLVAASDADEEEEAKVKAQHALLAVLEADEAKEKAQHALVAALDVDEEEEAKEKAQHALLTALDADEGEEAKKKAQHALVAALEEHEEEEAKEKAQHALVAALDADETMAIGPSASWSSSMPGDESVELKRHAVSALERAVETGALHEILHQYAQQSELRGTLLQVRDGLLEAAQTGKLLRLLSSMPHGQQQAEVKETSEPMLQPTERTLCSSSVGPAATQTFYVQPTPKAYMVASGNSNAGCAHPRLSGAREAQQELAALAQGKAELTAEVMKIQAMIEAATLKKQQVTRHAAASTRLV